MNLPAGLPNACQTLGYNKQVKGEDKRDALSYYCSWGRNSGSAPGIGEQLLRMWESFLDSGAFNLFWGNLVTLN